MATLPPRIELHLDINKTILLSDSAGLAGSPVEIVSQLCAEAALGAVSSDGAWTLVGLDLPPPSSAPPAPAT